MIREFFKALYADKSILYFNKDSGNVVFNYSGIGILNIDHNNTNLDNNLDDPDTIVLIRLLS